MAVYSENGDIFGARRMEKDEGTFTVQASDVPLASLRRKTRKLGQSKQAFHRKKVRLTPINEKDEADEKDETTSDCEETMSPVSIILTSPDGESKNVVGTFDRSDTPAVHRKSSETKLFLDLDYCNDELDNIPEAENEDLDPRVLDILSTLPPRPKCKRKVLPPSVTTGVDNLKPKKKKLLKLRSKYENTIGNASYSISKDLQNVIRKETLHTLNQERPKSAEHDVRVITLSDLSSANSSSVPDLPSILNKIAKSNDLRDLSWIQTQTNDRGGKVASAKTFMYEDSGALSTPRDDNDIKRGDKGMAAPKATQEKCLKGSDIASFYNMWDRDRNSRPFDKKGSDKFKINVHRDCLCSIRNCARKCFNQRNSVLPPILSPSRDI